MSLAQPAGRRSRRAPEQARPAREDPGPGYGRIRWRDQLYQVVDIAPLAAGYWQYVLESLEDPKRPRVSLPATDLADAEPA